AADIEPYQMDLRPLALARAAGRGDAIVVNMEPDSFDIVFITAGLPTVIHTISPRRDGATLEDNIRRLADELAKMAAFYQSGHPESPLSPATPLLLTGELAAGPPAIGLLQGEVEYPVAPLLPPVALPPELPAASFTASIGLALKKTNIKTPRQGDAPFHDININIFTGKYRRSRAPALPAGYIITGVLLAAAIVFLYPFYQAAWQLKAGNSARLAELDNLTREVGLATLTAEETVKKEETLREIITGTRAVRSVRESILGDRGNFTDYLGKVTLALPPGTDFTSVEMDSGRVTLQGEADSVFTVIDYATALEAAGAFREVRITRLDEAESAFSGEAGNVIKFEIIMSR
ncbi:MAG TPA: PilN domain-containing protein, partial [Dehalococcoidales bacterium]|nr:PilN domain-containing protein [Dehalococcoidales bacterium]